MFENVSSTFRIDYSKIYSLVEDQHSEGGHNPPQFRSKSYKNISLFHQNDFAPE